MPQPKMVICIEDNLRFKIIEKVGGSYYPLAMFKNWDEKVDIFIAGLTWFVVGFFSMLVLHFIEIQIQIFSNFWTYLENMKEGMGAFIGSGAALSAAIGAAGLAHYLSLKREKRKSTIKRVNMIIALKGEFIIFIAGTFLIKRHVKGIIDQFLQGLTEDESFMYQGSDKPIFPETPIFLKNPSFIGSLGPSLSRKIFGKREILLDKYNSVNNGNLSVSNWKSIPDSIDRLTKDFFEIEEALVELAFSIIEENKLNELKSIQKELVWEKENPISKRTKTKN